MIMIVQKNNGIRDSLDVFQRGCLDFNCFLFLDCLIFPDNTLMKVEDFFSLLDSYTDSLYRVFTNRVNNITFFGIDYERRILLTVLLKTILDSHKNNIILQKEVGDKQDIADKMKSTNDIEKLKYNILSFQLEERENEYQIKYWENKTRENRDIIYSINEKNINQKKQVKIFISI